MRYITLTHSTKAETDITSLSAISIIDDFSVGHNSLVEDGFDFRFKVINPNSTSKISETEIGRADENGLYQVGVSKISTSQVRPFQVSPF